MMLLLLFLVTSAAAVAVRPALPHGELHYEDTAPPPSVFSTTASTMLISTTLASGISYEMRAALAVKATSTHPVQHTSKSHIPTTITKVSTKPSATSSICKPKSICVDKIDACYNRYGG